MTYKVEGGTEDGTRISFGPFEASPALFRFAEMSRQGFRLITLIEVRTGKVLEIERFLRGNPGGVH